MCVERRGSIDAVTRSPPTWVAMTSAGREAGIFRLARPGVGFGRRPLISSLNPLLTKRVSQHPVSRDANPRAEARRPAVCWSIDQLAARRNDSTA